MGKKPGELPLINNNLFGTVWQAEQIVDSARAKIDGDTLFFLLIPPLFPKLLKGIDSSY